jgi:hypothetical protein
VDCLQPAARRQAPARSAAACSRSLSSRNPLAPGLMRCHALERQRRRGLTLALPHSASGVGRSESRQASVLRLGRMFAAAARRWRTSAFCESARQQVGVGSTQPALAFAQIRAWPGVVADRVSGRARRAPPACAYLSSGWVSSGIGSGSWRRVGGIGGRGCARGRPGLLRSATCRAAGR